MKDIGNYFREHPEEDPLDRAGEEAYDIAGSARALVWATYTLVERELDEDSIPHSQFWELTTLADELLKEIQRKLKRIDKLTRKPVPKPAAEQAPEAEREELQAEERKGGRKRVQDNSRIH